MRVYNVPNSAKKCHYIVYRLVNGAAWYYGAWESYEKALKQALIIQGQIIPIGEIETEV